jgi:peptidoglycan/xylan/chitin deacetylase (PgdA/CDA1 family)
VINAKEKPLCGVIRRAGPVAAGAVRSVNIALILDFVVSESEGCSRRSATAGSGWGMKGLRAYHKSSFAIALGAAIAVAGAFAFAGAARAEDCPGHPDAMGTSRVLVVEPGEYSQIGIMQYHQSLPLADKEVVVTFDDGPVPRYSNAILDTLAAQCVKATYFLVGAMARAYPATVRRIYEEGHTIGTHTEDHPARMQKLPIDKVRYEIDQGIADVGAALGDPTELAPFFRIPGLARTDIIDEELAARSLIVFSSDIVADDWHRRIKPADIVSRAMSRLQARGKGILLLHDIHPATVAALPVLLAKLKEAGFHIVHVVPAAAEQIQTAGEPTTRTRPAWPSVTGAPVEDQIVTAAPDLKLFAPNYRPHRRIVLADRSANAAYLALAAATEWTEPMVLTGAADEAEISAPDVRDVGLSLLRWPGGEEALELRVDASLAAQKPAPSAAPATSQPDPLE